MTQSALELKDFSPAPRNDRGKLDQLDDLEQLHLASASLAPVSSAARAEVAAHSAKLELQQQAASMLNNISLEAKRTQETLRAEAIEAIITILTGVSPSLCAHALREKVGTLIAQHQEQDRKGRLQVHVHPAMLEELLPPLAGPEAEGGVSIVPDGSLAPHGLTANWQDGGAQFDCDGIVAALHEFLQSELPEPRK